MIGTFTTSLYFSMFYDSGPSSTHFDYTAREYWWYLFLLGCMCCDFVGLNAQNIAFQNDSSGFVAIIGYMIVFYGFLADYFIFGLLVNSVQMAGALLIFVVNIGTTVYKLKQQRASE